MIDVWAVWPTVSPERSRPMVDLWHSRGYKVAVLINLPHGHESLPEAERVIVQPQWSGFPAAANALCRESPGPVVVVVGDDVSPDPDQTAQEIGDWFQNRFPNWNGVMQPTGDRFACTDKCAVSPWIGRGFIELAYGGRGPYWSGYYHYFCDEELQGYAVRCGAFAQREDVTQYHNHWQRQVRPMRPEHLKEAERRWQKDKDLFEERKRRNWPWD